MKKTVLAFSLLSAVLLAAVSLSGCKETESPASDTNTEVSANVSVSDNRTESSSLSEISSETVEENNYNADVMKAAARTALEKIVNDRILPDGSALDYDDSFGALSENRFAVCDVDGDGKNELIFSIVNAPSVGMSETIYGYDAKDGSFYPKLTEFPAISYLENGFLKAGWSHNQGLANPDNWPYTLYRYDTESDSYKVIAGVDSWDKSISEDFNGNAFPDDIDINGDGIVYLIERGNTTDTVSQEDYENWYKETIGDAAEISIPYQELTDENIAAIQ